MSERRMKAYYYRFSPTGCEAVDLILHAIACAGKAYHHTDMASASGTARLNGFKTRQIRRQNSGRCPMTDAGWAEKTVARKLGGQYVSLSPKLTAELLLAEHRPAVRVVKREIEAVRNDQRTYHSEERCLILGSLETVLKALQRGRE